ncbi:MAG: hypothetical protein ACE5J9_04890 [Methanosarcinales archaeon]
MIKIFTFIGFVILFISPSILAFLRKYNIGKKDIFFLVIIAFITPIGIYMGLGSIYYGLYGDLLPELKDNLWITNVIGGITIIYIAIDNYYEYIKTIVTYKTHKEQ